MKGTRTFSVLPATLLAVLTFGTLVTLGWLWWGEPSPEQQISRAFEDDGTAAVGRANHEVPGSTREAAPSLANLQTPAAREPTSRPLVLAELADALARGDKEAARALAARLRGAIRGDTEVLEAAGAILLDARESDLFRGALALILGTLKDEDAQNYLLDALTETEPSGDLTKWLLYGLGVWNERPDFDERFAFQPDGPWVVESPAGLRLPIRALLEDPAVLDMVEEYLLDARDRDLRRVALQVLRHSVAVERVRDAFLDVLDLEPDNDTQADCAEALGHWTVTPEADEPTAVAIRKKLLKEATQPEKDLLRFKVEPILRSARLTAGEVDAIAELLAASAGDFGSRYFAIEVAGAQAPVLLEDPATQAAGARLQNLLSETLAREADPKLREKAAEKLGGVPGPLSAQALVSAVEGDSAWHVRLAAARALGALDAKESADIARAALERAAQYDPDERVRKAAAASLSARSR